MNRRIETRHYHPNGVATGYLVNKDATEVYWITCDPNVFLTACSIILYDGFDAGGRQQWEGRPGQSRQYNFVPPIHCEQGVFIDCNAASGCLTVGFRPKKWDRPKPMKADVIEHPEA